jgi:hypothetical protein
MKKLLAITLLVSAFSAPTLAENIFTPDNLDDWTYSISYNFYTSHYLSDGYIDEDDGKFVEWNETNNLFGFRVNVNENIGYFIATGKNSFYETSVMSGIEFSTAHEIIEYGFDAGLATGYEKFVSFEVLPFVNPFVKLNLKLTDKLTASVRVGNMNFMATNAFFELKMGF